MAEPSNRDYKKTYEDMRGNLSGKGEKQSTENGDKDLDVEGEYYIRAGVARNLCFEWPDGRKLFLNYGYLVSCQFDVGSKTNIITLGFTSHTIQLEGYGLDKLYDKFVMHLPFLIIEQDARYADQSSEPSDEPIVIRIEVLSIETQKGSAEAEPFA
jgi:hypothetical protein